MSYPPPNRSRTAPVSIFGGGAEERMGAGELNTSAAEGKVEMVFRVQTHSHSHSHTRLQFILRHVYQPLQQHTQYMLERERG